MFIHYRNTDGEGNGPPLQDPGPSYQTEAQNGNPHEEAAVEAVQQEESSMHNIPEIEIMREADSELRAGSPFNVPLHPDDMGDDRGTEPVLNDQDMVLPDMKEVRTPTSAFPVDQQLSGQKSYASIGEAPENFDADNSFGGCIFALHFCWKIYLVVSCFWMIGKVPSNIPISWYLKKSCLSIREVEWHSI